MKFYKVYDEELPLDYPFHFQRRFHFKLLIAFKLSQHLPCIAKIAKLPVLESISKYLKIGQK